MDAETPRASAGHESVQASEGDRVRRRIRPRLSYANVMSTIAVFVALGGSSYAAVTLNGKNLKHRSVGASKIKRNTLTNLEIRESRLTTVPKAAIAESLTERGADALLRCPDRTVNAAGTCIEAEPKKTSASYGEALQICKGDTTTHLQRRLPTHGELVVAFDQSDVVFNGPELTSDVFPSATAPGGLGVLFLADRAGSVGITTNDVNGERMFRCAVDPRPRGGQ